MSNEFFDNMSPKKSLILGGLAGLFLVCLVGIVLAITSSSGDEATVKQQVASKKIQESVPSSLVPSEKPEVELFVMSYCPYGTQMQKAFLPVMDLLGDKADIKIKFVYYTMHGDKEARENNRQYCVQKDNPDKYNDFLTCFLTNGGTADDISVVDKCMADLGIDKTATEKCMTDTVAQFNVSGTDYPVNLEDNQKYGIQGSPTLVINGVSVNPSSRSPEAVKQLICSAFTEKPAECDESLDTTPEAAGFGFDNVGSNTSASCS